MAQYDVPIVDQTIDTSDPSGSAANFGLGIVSLVSLLAMGGAAKFVWTRAQDASGVDAPDIPGV